MAIFCRKEPHRYGQMYCGALLGANTLLRSAGRCLWGVYGRPARQDDHEAVLCVHFARRTPIRHHMHYMLLKVNWHSKYPRPARLGPRCPELLHSSDVWLHRRQQQGWRPSSSCGHMAPAFEQVSLALLLGPQARCRACTAAAQTSSTGGSLS